MTALRQRLIEDLTVRNYSPRTVEAYVAAVVKLTKHFGRSPDQLTAEEVRAFQVALLAKQPSWSQFNQVVAGLRFFFGTTLLRAEMVEMLPYGKRPKRLPTVLSVEEVGLLLQAAQPGRERVLLQTACACGLWISEMLHLQVSRVYRGKFLAGLRALQAQGKLKLPDLLAASLTAWLRPLYAKDWVVYAKPPFGGPEQVLKYLARYTHRVALSNHRLVKLEEGRVTFRYRDYADSREEKLLTLAAEEFLRRFVQHVLPKGFMKIRHYGLLASRQREARLHQARRLLLATLAVPASVSSSIEPAEPARCPACGSVRRARGEPLPRTGASPFVGVPARESMPASVANTS